MHKDTNTFDYIIVGGGSAGCVLANRLSSDENKSILLIEAGKKHLLSKYPISFALFIDRPSVNWCYRSVPEKNTNFREIPVPRGKLLGGSSSINGMVYVRGQRLDFDTWAQMGNKGWSYDDILLFIKRWKTLKAKKTELRGIGGPSNINIVNDDNPLYEAIFSAGKLSNLSRNYDYNGDLRGLAFSQTTVDNGRRISSEFAYLRPIYKRKNFYLKTDTLVMNLIFKNKKCIGVVAKKSK